MTPKDSSLNFRGSLLSYFWPILLISAVITILEDFGSPLPARTVTVKKARNRSSTRENFEIRNTFDQRWTDTGVRNFSESVFEVYSNTRFPSPSPN